MDSFMLLIDDRERSINNMVEKFRSEMTKIFDEMPNNLNIYIEATTRENERDIKEFLKSSKISKYELSDDMLDDVMDAFLSQIENKMWGDRYQKIQNNKDKLSSLIQAVDSNCRDWYQKIIKEFRYIVEQENIEKAKDVMTKAVGMSDAKGVYKILYEAVDEEFKKYISDEATMLDVYFFVILEEAFEYAEKHIWRDK